MNRGVRFTKMSGAGNDFIVLDAADAMALGTDPAPWARRLCRRRLSIGADGLIVVAPSDDGRVRVDFFNPDGSPAFCGNGSRCAARFAELRGMAGASMTLETAAGAIPAQVEAGRVRLQLPAPVDRGRCLLEVGGDRLDGRHIVAGVPHFVVQVDAVDGDLLERWGRTVRRHPRFGDAGANFDLVARLGPERLSIRTWERGVEGETLSCGSGAVAAAFALWLAGGARRVELVPASGIALTVELCGETSDPSGARLEGDARVVYEGTVAVETERAPR